MTTADVVQVAVPILAGSGPVLALAAYHLGRLAERRSSRRHPCRQPAPGAHVRVIRPPYDWGTET